jgi:hypothetical protein
LYKLRFHIALLLRSIRLKYLGSSYIYIEYIENKINLFEVRGADRYP